MHFFQIRPLEPSQRKESASSLPEGHREVPFGGGHLLEICGLSIGGDLPELGEPDFIEIPPTQIEAVLKMEEAHSLREGEVQFISLELILRNAKHVQLGRESLDLEQILGLCSRRLRTG